MVNNDDQFMEMLKALAPDLYFVKKAMLERGVFADEVMEIVYKLGIGKNLDEGYCRIVVDTMPIENKDTQDMEVRVCRVRLIQDKVLAKKQKDLKEGD